MSQGAAVAYFSMEIALRDDLPTYAGGLGMLAGDMLRAAADLGLPMVGVTLLHRKGYFRQRLDADGNQREEPVQWSPEAHLLREPVLAELTIDGRSVQIGAWRFDVAGVRGHVPVYLLDTDFAGNDPVDRALTDSLYSGDSSYRLRQEAVLGIGGLCLLRALGYAEVGTFHMNEGHSALLTLAMLEEQAGAGPASELQIEAVRSRCVFTTHTPVPAGHDQFELSQVERVLGPSRARLLRDAGCCLDGTLNMTHLALRLSRYVNGVALRHGQISRNMFPGYPIDSITNGVHAGTWICEPLAAVLDRHLGNWRRDNLNLRYATFIPAVEIGDAHRQAKRVLLEEVARRTGQRLDPDVLTIGFARRATRYKAFDLVLTDVARLGAIHRDAGPVQLVFAGKAHPHDADGREMIRAVFAAGRRLRELGVRVVYLEDYDWVLARAMCAGCDLWLNTPQRPQEASGTSGMKAALNAVPSLSTLDGWWIEGHMEGVTGWSIGDHWDAPGDRDADVESLYHKLANIIVPMFYAEPARWREVMRSALVLNGAFFNSQRMALQYAQNAYAR
jgi:glycogen phosphorylase